MKASLLKIPLFGFTATLIFLPLYGVFLLYKQVMPGTEGLVFSSPLSMALLPALTLALLVTINSLHHHPGRPKLSLLISAGCFFLALTLSFIYPVDLGWTPPPGPNLHPGTIYSDTRGGLFFDKIQDGRLENLITKTPGGTMKFYSWGDYDRINNRIIFPDGSEPETIPLSVADLEFFSPPDVLKGIFSDFNYVHQLLQAVKQKGLNQLIILSLLLTGLFTGLTVLMHAKVWPLIKWTLLLLGLRGLVYLVRFSFHDAVYITSRWTTDSQILTALPYTLIFLMAGVLVNITLFRLPFSPREGK